MKKSVLIRNGILLLGMAILIYSCKEKEEKAVSIEQKSNVLPINKDKESIDLTFLKMENKNYVIPWKYLMSVKFEEVFKKDMEMKVSLPLFNDTLQALDGQNVVIEGFYIPVDETGNDKIVILSAFPFSQCFFCGKAGVESIVDVLCTSKLPRLKMDSKIKFKGRFRLNRDNFDYLIYVLEEAELIN